MSFSSSGKLHLIYNKGVKQVVKRLGVTKLKKGGIGVPRMREIIKGVIISRWCYLTFFFVFCFVGSRPIPMSLLNASFPILLSYSFLLLRMWLWFKNHCSVRYVLIVSKHSVNIYWGPKICQILGELPGIWKCIIFLPSENIHIHKPALMLKLVVLTAITLLARVSSLAFRESLAIPRSDK